MADILKGTRWWATDPTWSIVDVNVTGAVLNSSLTAAQAHDASDVAAAELQTGGDGVGVEGSATLQTHHAMNAAPAGGIKFVRVKMRARVAVGAGAGTVSGYVSAMIDGVNVGGQYTLGGAYQNFDADFTVDPIDGTPWTVAKFAGRTWGIFGSMLTSDPGTYATQGKLRITEYTLKVWGEDVIASVTGASDTGIVGAEAFADPGQQDGSVVAPLLMTLDGSSVPAVARSFKSGLNDQSTSTKDTYNTAGTGTVLNPLYGAGSQGLQGSSGAGNGINGTGTIAGVKARAIIRVSKQAAGTITNVRFGTAMGLQALVTPPTIRDYDAGLTEAQYEVVETALITTGALGNPFTWGNGVDSVWASFFGWTMNWTLAGAGTKQMDIAEAWVEIYGPVGAAESSPIELTLAINLAPKIMRIQSTLL